MGGWVGGEGAGWAECAAGQGGGHAPCPPPLPTLTHPHPHPLHCVQYIILEYMENGALSAVIKANRFGPFPEALVAVYTQQVLQVRGPACQSVGACVRVGGGWGVGGSPE